MKNCKKVCAVSVCQSPVGVSYHRFPRDPMLRSGWIRFCGRSDVFNVDTARICSLHFTAGDFERDLRNELLQLPVRSLLKKNSVPSVVCPDQQQQQQHAAEKCGVRSTSRRRQLDSLVGEDAVASPPIKKKVLLMDAQVQVGDQQAGCGEDALRLRLQVQQLQQLLLQKDAELEQLRLASQVTKWSCGCGRRSDPDPS